jgi:hypothetical protein
MCQINSRQLRLADSRLTFPGVRGIELLRNPSRARERLEILLAEPLILGTTAPIWWWRGGDLQIETVQFFGPAPTRWTVFSQ